MLEEALDEAQTVICAAQGAPAYIGLARGEERVDARALVLIIGVKNSLERSWKSKELYMV